jgi:peroxiredoxin
LLRPFSLTASDGATVQLTDFKQRSNLVLILHHSTRCAECLAFLGKVGEHLESYANAEAVVLGICADSPETMREVRLPFRLLSDSAGRVAAREAVDVPSVLIADRFGEMWAGWRAGDRHTFPAVDEMASWLEFIELQCRECEAPEWPVVSERTSEAT